MGSKYDALACPKIPNPSALAGLGYDCDCNHRVHLGLVSLPVSPEVWKDFTTPDAFVGFFTMYGPHGVVECSTKEETEAAAAELLDKWPNALSGATRSLWPLSSNWRIQIWSKIELA